MTQHFERRGTDMVRILWWAQGTCRDWKDDQDSVHPTAHIIKSGHISIPQLLSYPITCKGQTGNSQGNKLFLSLKSILEPDPQENALMSPTATLRAATALGLSLRGDTTQIQAASKEPLRTNKH
jgi:hypothetical protein